MACSPEIQWEQAFDKKYKNGFTLKRRRNSVGVDECGRCRKRGQVWPKTPIVPVGQSKLRRKSPHTNDSGATIRAINWLWKKQKWFRVLTLRRARLNSFSHSPQWVTSSSGAHWASLETQTVASLLGKGKYNLSQIFDDKQFRNLNHFRLSASNLVSRNRTPTSSRAFSWSVQSFNSRWCFPSKSA